MDIDLKLILDDVKEWLKFAEAKHAALITFNSALIFFFSNLFFEKKIPNNYNFIVVTFILIIICSTLISLISFIPKLFSTNFIQKYIEKYVKQKLLSKSPSNIDDNLLFYVNISKYNEIEYIDMFYKRYIEKDDFKIEDISNFEKDMISQIIGISFNAFKKYILFSISIKILIITLILSVIPIIIA